MGENFEVASPGSGGGGVIIKSAIKTDTQSTTTGNGSWVDVTGLSITHTPASGNSVLVRALLNAGGTTANAVGMRFVRDSTVIGAGDAAGTRNPGSSVAYDSAQATWQQSLHGEVNDAAVGDGSSHIWKVQFCFFSGGSGTAYINRSASDVDANYTLRGASTLTIMEFTP